MNSTHAKCASLIAGDICYCCCSAREVQLSSLSPVLSHMAATAIPIPGLIPCNPLPPSHPHYASAGIFSASASEAPPQADESANTSNLPPYQISSAEIVTVSSFKAPVHVMSTKTRPKRIGIVGSDGKTYTFLLKVCPAYLFPHMLNTHTHAIHLPTHNMATLRCAVKVVAFYSSSNNSCS